MGNSGVSISTGVSDLAREKLREAVVAYGRSAFADPRRCEAILRDLCPNAPREIFLLVSALRENVAAQLISHEAMPESAVFAALSHRLAESLGLSEDAARWAVESWRFALDDNPGLKGAGEGLRALTISRTAPAEPEGPPVLAEAASHLDWPWLAMCFLAVAASVMALAGGAWVSFFHYWQTWKGGLVEIAAMAIGLATVGFVQLVAARSFGQMNAPDPRSLDPRTAPFALLPEVLAVLLLPLVPVALPVMWVGEWWSELHAAGLPHTLGFHVIRGFESLLLSVFLWRWIHAMTVIQGRIAVSLVRQR
ncbi:membrane hypothetical protein [Candidatus Sulfopaludibacter sp. SbA3]|nr:membrane hypothetical protein [Candidatus Sulfopaludibacter sp. SbA3]